MKKQLIATIVLTVIGTFIGSFLICNNYASGMGAGFPFEWYYESYGYIEEDPSGRLDLLFYNFIFYFIISFVLTMIMKYIIRLIKNKKIMRKEIILIMTITLSCLSLSATDIENKTSQEEIVLENATRLEKNINSIMDHIDKRNIDRMESILPQLKKSINKYKCIMFVAEAMIAEEQNDDKKAIQFYKDALNIAPKNMTSYIHKNIREYKKRVELRLFKFNYKRIALTSEGGNITFKELLGNNKAILIYFWKSTHLSSVKYLSELQKRADKVLKDKVVLVGMNLNEDTDLVETIRKENNINIPWLIDRIDKDKEPLSVILGISKMPQMTLIYKRGKILYNGEHDSFKLNYQINDLPWRDVIDGLNGAAASGNGLETLQGLSEIGVFSIGDLGFSFLGEAQSSNPSENKTEDKQNKEKEENKTNE